MRGAQPMVPEGLPNRRADRLAKYCRPTVGGGAERDGEGERKVGGGVRGEVVCFGVRLLAAAPQPAGPRPKGTESSGTLHTALCKPSPASQPRQPSLFCAQAPDPRFSMENSQSAAARSIKPTYWHPGDNPCPRGASGAVSEFDFISNRRTPGTVQRQFHQFGNRHLIRTRKSADFRYRA